MDMQMKITYVVELDPQEFRIILSCLRGGIKEEFKEEAKDLQNKLFSRRNLLAKDRLRGILGKSNNNETDKDSTTLSSYNVYKVYWEDQQFGKEEGFPTIAEAQTLVRSCGGPADLTVDTPFNLTGKTLIIRTCESTKT